MDEYRGTFVMATKLSFREYMDKVDERLTRFPNEALVDIIKSMAREVPPQKRAEFVMRLAPSSKRRPRSSSDELLKGIKALTERVEDGDYCDGWGWDDDYMEERDWGDEGWADEVDDFFLGAHDALIAGDFRMARDAYGALFDIIDLGDEPGHLPGNPCPTDMLETDLNEALACFIRAAYLSATPKRRPETLWKAIEGYSYYADGVNLRAAIDSAQEPLPGFSNFLKDWTALLKKKKGDGALRLLREAVVLSDGTAGIEKLALKSGKKHPSAFVDWITALEQDGDFQGMITAATKGLETVPEDLEARSQIGEGLARAGKHLGDKRSELTGWREAFHSDPSLPRLLTLLSVAGMKGRQKKEIDRAIARILSLVGKRMNANDGPWYPNIFNTEKSKSTASRTLLTQALLLAGRHKDAFELCQAVGALGWFYSDNPKRWVVTFLLVCLQKDRSLKRSPNLKGLWDRTYGDLDPFCLYEDPETPRSFERAMFETISSVRFSAKDKKKYLSWCVEEAGARVDAIVSGKHRKSYDKAAELLLASAEVLVGLDRGDEAVELVERYRCKYPRHRAFQEELRNTIRKSKITQLKRRS